MIRVHAEVRCLPSGAAASADLCPSEDQREQVEASERGSRVTSEAIEARRAMYSLVTSLFPCLVSVV
jgi:hypothetical protein